MISALFGNFSLGSRRSLAASILVSSVLFAGPAAAGPKDAEAKKMAEDAIFTDYLATNFEGAANKLEAAAATCGDDACSAPVKARILRDLGVVTIAGLKDFDAGKQHFVAAIAIDPSIELDPDLSTDEIQTAFAQARKEAGAQTAAPPATATAEGPPAAGEGPPEQEETVASIDASTEVCPPDFPGCEDQMGGEYCEIDADCGSSDFVCRANTCVEPGEDEGSMGPKLWLSLALQQDWLYLGKLEAACSPSNLDYTCYDSNDATVEVDSSGGFDGGAVLATTRVLVGADYVVYRNITLGARVGFALRGAPADFFPVHVEGRGAYWFAGDPSVAESAFHPYAFLGGGLAEVDGSMEVQVADSTAPNGRSTADAWRQTGLNFVALGPGFMYNVTPGIGLFFEAQGMYMFTASDPGFALKLGGAFGL